jgi:hypothetical protein
MFINVWLLSVFVIHSAKERKKIENEEGKAS